MCLDVWIWTTLTQKMWCKLHIKDRMQWFAIHFGSIFNCIGHKDKMFNVTLIESFQGGPDGWLARHTHAHVQRPCIHHNSPGFESKDKIVLNKSGNIPFFFRPVRRTTSVRASWNPGCTKLVHLSSFDTKKTVIQKIFFLHLNTVLCYYVILPLALDIQSSLNGR